ncbi:very short patch repair endonuclease [Fluviicoccus sp.]|uniref:very short patch repair endonuclease n=1 Tax=Fluviicoccus sp. TaxID=2003552 RepID=UPI00351ECF8E
MTDTFAPEKRSSIMRRVKSRDTGAEMKVRRLVWGLGFRYRLHVKDLPGRPDLVFRGRRKVIFVHGCFWHGHDCKRGARVPATNTEYWRAKVAGNVARDAENCRKLGEQDWRWLVVWECQLRDMSPLQERLMQFLGK